MESQPLLRSEEFMKRSKFHSVVAMISKWLCVVSAVALAAMMLSTTIDVVGRAIFNAPLKGDYEFVGLMLIVAATFGLGWCQILKGHIRIPLFYDMFPRTGKMVLDILAYLCCLIAGVLIFWQVLLLAFDYLNMSTGNISETLKWPFAPFMFMLSFGFGWYSFITALDLYNFVREVIKR